jgi:hypothetical protein
MSRRNRSQRIPIQRRQTSLSVAAPVQLSPTLPVKAALPILPVLPKEIYQAVAKAPIFRTFLVVYVWFEMDC